ncbi:MAG: 3-phosphoshikimate 1-carboxyvinyltransferase [Solirubrobacteraceae bacterium]
MPGSKSITNRALLCAALAPGCSRLTGALFADDTRAMLGAVSAIGADVTTDEAGGVVDVVGADVRHPSAGCRVDAQQSGTTSRFLLPVVALGSERCVVDGDAQLRVRPFGPLISALRDLGADVRELGAPDRLPVAITGPVQGGEVVLPGDVTSQFLSGLLLAAPMMRNGLRVRLSSSPVSVPYLRLTAAVMAQFGVHADADESGAVVQPGTYRAREFTVEPDASAASYFLGAAAITGGRVTIEGLGSASLQGDIAFADVLERMGARVDRAADAITVRGPSTSAGLTGVDVDAPGRPVDLGRYALWEGSRVTGAMASGYLRFDAPCSPCGGQGEQVAPRGRNRESAARSSMASCATAIGRLAAGARGCACLKSLLACAGWCGVPETRGQFKCWRAIASTCALALMGSVAQRASSRSTAPAPVQAPWVGRRRRASRV